MNKQLHWTQRIALVRHNLHSASRSGDFTFFKTLQAYGLLEGMNHVATLSAALGDEADTVLAAMDNLNAGIAYVHQDAFKNVYESLKTAMREDGEEASSNKSKIFVDTTMQKQMADMAIDKMTNSAVALIQHQPEAVQEQTANVWITGATIVADCMEISLKQMEGLEYIMDDFIRLEDSWNAVKGSVVCAITGLRGVFSLMDTASNNPEKTSPRSQSFASATGGMFRKLSTAFSAASGSQYSPPSSRSASIVSAPGGSPSRQGSIAPVYRTPNYVRNSISTGCPTRMPNAQFDHHKLSMIPPTPALEDAGNPFDTNFDASIPPVPALTLQQSRMGQAVM